MTMRNSFWRAGRMLPFSSARLSSIGLLVGLIFFMLLPTGCRQTIEWSWASSDILDLPPGDWEEAPAEMLLRADRFVIAARRGSWYTLIHRHEVVRINSEAGLDRAEVTIYSPDSDASLDDFAARVVQPDGQVHLVDEDDLIVDTNDDDTRYTFRFPRARVGSIIEYAYTFANDDEIRIWHSRWISTDIPVRRYNLEMWIDKNLKYRLKAYGTNGAGFSRVDMGDYYRLSLPLREIAPIVDEWQGPNETLTHTWYVYQAARGEFEWGTKDYQATWAHAARPMGQWFFLERESLEDFEDPRTYEDCSDRQCLETIVNETFEDVKPDRFGDTDGVRPMPDVLADGWGSAWEIAVLMTRRLEEAGLDVHLGIANRDGLNRFDDDIVWMKWFDHPLLIVSDEKRFGEEIWIDPTCEYCELGELPRWSNQTEVLRIRYTNDKFRVRMEIPDQPTPGAATRSRVVRIRLDPEQNQMTLHQVEEYQNASARGLMMSERELNGSTARDWVEQFWSNRFANAELESYEAPECQREAGVCRSSQTVTVGDIMTVDSRELIVPLELVAERFGGLKPPSRRVQDVVLDHESIVESIEVELPDGWIPVEDELPKPVEIRTPSCRVTVEYEWRSEEQLLVVSRTLKFFAGTYDVDEYSTLYEALAGFERPSDTALILVPQQNIDDETTAPPESVSDTNSEDGGSEDGNSTSGQTGVFGDNEK